MCLSVSGGCLGESGIGLGGFKSDINSKNLNVFHKVQRHHFITVAFNGSKMPKKWKSKIDHGHIFFRS